jgi:calcium/calmodulin-dependent protein kinase I
MVGVTTYIIGYMHRDLKPANIFFKQMMPLKKYGLEAVEPNILISDFGVASQIRKG